MQMHEHAIFAMAAKLRLISHKLCPYVQRAVIALTEKGIAFERIDIDLDHKPDWFVAISPLGKTPVLQVGDVPIFESAAILEYLEETSPTPLHPGDPLRRAEHRAWIEFGSTVLNDIAGFYAAPDEAAFKVKTSQLEQRFARLEARIAAAPWFDSENFSLVDAVFGPVFRYFDVFDDIADFGILAAKPKLARWRKALAARPSVRTAVRSDYPALLRDFLERRNSWLSRLQARAAA
jgi:glutathione S-transferase